MLDISLAGRLAARHMRNRKPSVRITLRNSSELFMGWGDLKADRQVGLRIRTSKLNWDHERNSLEVHQSGFLNL